MAARTASVTVKLLDQLSSPARIVGNSLRALRGDMSAMSRASTGINQQIAASTARIKGLRSSLVSLGVTSVAAAWGLRRVMRSGVELETVMMDIRQKADLSAEATKALTDRIKAMAPTVNKAAGEMAHGVDFLMGAGLDPDRAMAMMPAIGQAAAAYRAEIEDLAKAGFAAMDNLKVRTEDFARTLDVMVTAGKEGSFEIRDMATYFPQLTAAAEALGMKGNSAVAKLAAALQIARKGAGDASSAATNTANLMQKIISPETTKKFKKLGVDIRKELKAVQKTGGDPFIMIAEQTKKALKGDLSKLGDVFEDAQVQQFLRPLIANLERYKQIRDKAGAASGTVDEDFKKRSETLQERVNRLMNALDALAIKITDALTPYIGALADALTPLVAYITDVVGKYPDYIAAITGVTAGLIGLAAALAAFKLLGAGLSLFSFKGLRGLLGYLAPKAEAAGPAAGASAGAAAGGRAGAGSSFGTAKPGMMSPSQIAAAKQGASNLTPSTALGKLVGGIKNGLVGGLVYYAGTKAIDAGLDALPKSGMTAEQQARLQQWNDASIIGKLPMVLDSFKNDVADFGGWIEKISKPSDTGPRPLNEGDLERSRRAQDEMKREPEGARGRAMMNLDGKATGVEAGAELGQGIKEGLTGQQGAIAAAADAIMAALKAKLGTGIDVPVRPKVEGLGAALRGIHADAGVY